MLIDGNDMILGHFNNNVTKFSFDNFNKNISVGLVFY